MRRILFNSIYVLGVALSLISCNNNNDEIIMQSAKRVIDCNLDDAQKVSDLSAVFENIDVVTLESKHLIGLVDDIHTDESGIYLTSNNTLYAYNWNGEELFYLDRKGRALSDYLEIKDFSISKKYIAISDPESMKILLFNKSDGEFNKSIRLDFFPEEITFMNETTLAVNCGGVDGSRLVRIDIETGDVVDGYLHFDALFTEPLPQVFSSINGTTLYRIPFYNDFYTISDDKKMEKALSFDFKDKNFNVNDLKTINIMGVNMLIDEKGNVNIENIYDVNSTIAIDFKCQSISEESRYLLFVDTLNQTKYLFDNKATNDNILFYDYVALPYFYDSNEDGFISVLYPDFWISTFKSISEDRKNTSNYQKASSIYEIASKNENPSILVYRLKK